MKIFETVSSENTVEALRLAFEKAAELSTDIILSTTSGASACAAAELAAQTNFKGRLVAITHVWGYEKPDENNLTEENRKKLLDAGVTLVTAAHTLSGVERSISGKFSGVYPVEIIAYSLRMLSQGLKVCVEIGAMALDAGAISSKAPVVAIAGTGRGLDTACVITPGYSAKIFETRVHEILCKPY